MSRYVDGVEFITEHCCSCGIPFAMTADFSRRRRKDGKLFCCPNGHQQHYTGKSEEQKLRERLERTEREATDAFMQAASEREHRERAERRYKRIRARVSNGVCPCCSRTFQNLMQHMKSKHPDFGKEKTLRTVRSALGLTLQDLAEEVGLSAPTVSNYERGNHVCPRSAQAIESWLETVS
jgi:DNA-binding XRE family transcriptional regulator